MTFRSAATRITDRVRPWRARVPTKGATSIAVVGAGPAGLATAAVLRRRGANAVVFDARDTIGGSWPSRYDSLRLNTVRWMSDLPGYRMPRALGRWVGRDELTHYLNDYAEHHQLDVRLGARMERLDRSGSGWTVTFADHAAGFDGVVIATGGSREPVSPAWPGIAAFAGHVSHAESYQRPADFTGQRVLVVGAGSSGGEICVELARAGIDVTWSVRTAPQVFPREVFGVPTTPFGPLAEMLPDAVLDRAGPWLERRIYGRRDYLPTPTSSMMRLFRRCKEPLTADGIVTAIRSSHVRVTGAVMELTSSGALLVDGTTVECDHVVTATGYRAGLESAVGHLGVLDAQGRPIATNPLPGLAFVGFRIPFTGTLWAIDSDARAAAQAVTRRTDVMVVRPQGLEP